MNINNQIPIKVAIESHLPTNHLLNNIAEVAENVIQFSSLLRIEKTDNPDLLIKLEKKELGMGIIISMYEHGSSEAILQMAALENPISEKSEILPYQFLTGLLFEAEKMITFMSIKKWCTQMLQEISYEISIINTIPPQAPLSEVAQAYELALQELQVQLPHAETTLKGKIEITIQYGEYKKDILDILLCAESPTGYTLIQDIKNEYFTPEGIVREKRYEAQDQVHAVLGTIDLSLSNFKTFHSKSSLRELQNLITYVCADDWMQMLHEIPRFAAEKQIISDKIELTLFPKSEDYMVSCSLHETIKSQACAKLCKQDLQVLFAREKQPFIGGGLMCEVVYTDTSLDINIQHKGKGITTAQIPIEFLNTDAGRKDVLKRLYTQITNTCILPVTFYSLRTQGNA